MLMAALLLRHMRALAEDRPNIADGQGCCDKCATQCIGCPFRSQ